MLKIAFTKRFQKDVKLAQKRGYPLEKMKEVVTRLAAQEPLDAKYRDHLLVGDYAGYRECHIQPDWLLIYDIQEENLVLLLSRTGTHSDLF